MVKLKTQAGQRIKALRQLFGITQKDFAELIGIPLTRYKSIEILNTRTAEDVLATVCTLFPSFMAYVVIEGDIYLKSLAESSSSYERLAVARYDARSLPSDSGINEHIIDDR